MLSELTVGRFLEETASRSPAPGGGSVSALAGALGCALAEMVACLTSGEKYIDVAEEMARTGAKARECRMKLLECMQRDTDSFNGCMKAFSMPKSTDAERKVRSEAIQAALKTAAAVPLETAATASEVLDMARTVLEHGNSSAASDAIVCALLARDAVFGALLNVRINLGSIKDPGYLADMAAKVDELRRLTAEKAARVLRCSELSADMAD